MAKVFKFKGFHPCDDGKELFIMDEKKVIGRYVQGFGMLSSIDGTRAFIPIEGSTAKLLKPKAEPTVGMFFIEVYEVIPETVEQVDEP